MQGWIKVHRKMLHSDIFQNEKLLKVFMYCLLKATHKERKQLIGLQTVELEPGQFVFGRKKASEELNMNESTVYKYMKFLESQKTITMNSNNKFTIVTVGKWHDYQALDAESEQQNNNKITTKEQQNNTNKNVKNVKNKEYIVEIINYLNDVADKNYRYTTKKTQQHINARLEEGFTIDDFKKVVDIKTSEWKHDPKMNKYLRPETLFGNKFESYLNQNEPIENKSKGIDRDGL